MNLRDFALSWGMLGLAAVLNVAGLYALKGKLTVMGAIPVTSVPSLVDYVLVMVRSPMVLLGAACILAAPLPHAVALSRMPLAVAYPASVAVTTALLLPVTILGLGEAVTPSRGLGLALLLVSLVLLYK